MTDNNATLVTQPSWMPTRKVLAGLGVLIVAAVLRAFGVLPENTVIESLDVADIIEGVGAFAAAYWVKNYAVR